MRGLSNELFGSGFGLLILLVPKLCSFLELPSISKQPLHVLRIRCDWLLRSFLLLFSSLRGSCEFESMLSSE